MRGGLDIIVLGIGRMGNIATNEPGSTLTSTSRIILTDAISREEMTMSFGSQEPVPPCTLTMGVATILKAKKIFLTASAVLASDLQGEILVGVEHHHVGEAQAFLMTAYQLFKHGCETLACAKTQHTLAGALSP